MATLRSSLSTACEALRRDGSFAPASYYYGYFPARAEPV